MRYRGTYLFGRIRLLACLLLVALLIPTVLSACTDGKPVDDPTERPDATPTEAITDPPVGEPTEAPTDVVTEAPTDVVTEEPTDVVTEAPTDVVTEEPTDVVTEEPTDVVTEEPTDVVTEVPTDAVTEVPTEITTEKPTEAPTEKPDEDGCEAGRHSWGNEYLDEGDGHFRICTLCGEADAKLAHVSSGEATCTEACICVICGHIIEVELGHDTYVTEGFEADCESEGLTDGISCRRCGEDIKEQVIVPPSHAATTVYGHAATCTREGLTDGEKCSRCGLWITEQAVIDKLPHAYETVAGYAATCTSTGRGDGKKCSVCGTWEVSPTVIAALGHKFNALGCCGRCNLDTSSNVGENYGGVVISKVYGNGGKTDGAVGASFIELYNTSSSKAKLGGVCLYYSDGREYTALHLSPYEINGHGYLLIKCRYAEGYDTSFEVLRIDSFDGEWDIDISNKKFELVLAPSGTALEYGSDLDGANGVISYVAADEAESVNIYRVHKLSKSRMIVRTELSKDVGYHRIDLAVSGTAELKNVLPRSSEGVNSHIKTQFNEVKFSAEGGVYSSAMSIGLTAPDGWTIYYTLNGDDPREIDSARLIYSHQIGISPYQERFSGWGETINLAIATDSGITPRALYFGGTVIKAYATNGETETAVYTQTYFVSSLLASLETKVLSVSVTKEELLNPESPYFNFAGFDKKPRATVYFEMFDESGKKQGSSWAEVAVNGHGSAGLPMKSLRFYLKKPTKVGEGDNDPSQSSLEYDIFDGTAKNSLGQAITSFDRILFRNAGNDFCISMLRDAFAHKLSEGMALDHMAYTPTFMFINGEFWGLYNCRERYCEEYFVSHYGVLEENVCMLENVSPIDTGSWDTDYVANTGDDGAHDIYAKEFNDLVQYMKDNDLSDPVHYNYVAERIDIDSFIDYWVLNTYLCNADWPGNNIKLWRNLSADDPSGMDTKWRFLVLDLDSSMSFPQPGGSDNTLYYINKFNDINENTRCGAMMYNLCKNEGFKMKFIARAYTLVKGQLSYSNASSLLMSMQQKISPLVQYQCDRYYQRGATDATWAGEVYNIKEFLRNRENTYLNHMYSYFGVTENQIKDYING